MPETAPATSNFNKFFLLEKYDQFKGIATGIATAEAVDRDKEILDYAKSKPYFQTWSESVHKDSGGKSVGNLRLQHDDKKVAGKLNSIEFNDEAKMIRVEAQVIDPVAKELLESGSLTGFSIGGRYISKTPDVDGTTRYVADPCEISVVDRPALPGAHFQSVKADGSVELRKFAKYEASNETPELEVTHPVIARDKPIIVDAEGNKENPTEEPEKPKDDGTTKAVRYLVPDGQHLPVTDEAGKPSHSHMGAAWAALHGGYRGNKYEGPDKDKAIAALVRLYHSEGMETPDASKSIQVAIDLADTVDMIKSLDIETSTEQISALLDSLEKAITEKKMPDDNKDITTLDKAARHSIHQKISAAKAHVDGLMDHCAKSCKTMHAHLDGIAKVMGGGPEVMDEGGTAEHVTEGRGAGAPQAPGASDISSKADTYVSIGKDKDGREIFVKEDKTPMTPEEMVKAVVKGILEVQKQSVEAIGDRSNVRPFVKAVTKENDVTTNGAPSSNANGIDEATWKAYGEGDPAAIKKVQSNTANKWQAVPSRFMNPERMRTNLGQ